MSDKPKKIKYFTDLYAWQEGHKLVVNIYKITEKFPKKEMYSLVDQMRRAATSVTSNIAEGFGRYSFKEKIHFHYLAKGSLTELKNQLYISKDVGYISDIEFDDLYSQTENVDRLIHGLIKNTRKNLRVNKK